jgi:hypothetical protein
MNEILRCHHCDDVIGVYEPMVVLTNLEARNTSRAAEQDHEFSLGECYHHACYTLVHGENRPR